jgi:hypothetical protein
METSTKVNSLTDRHTASVDIKMVKLDKSMKVFGFKMSNMAKARNNTQMDLTLMATL